MLSAMRKSVDNIFIKALLTLLALSFMFWGVGSWIQPGNNADKAAMVDNEIISRTMIERRVQNVVGSAYDTASSEISAYRSAFTEQAINTTLIDLRAKDLGIKPGPDTIVASLRSEEAFSDDSGRFSEERFLRFLRDSQQTKRDFFHAQRNIVARISLQKLMEFTPEIPADIMSAVASRRFEERRTDVIVVKATPQDSAAMPTDTELMQTYKQHEQRFVSPEYRTFTFLAIHPQHAEKSIEYDEDSLNAYYSQREENYRMPERRVVKQYLFDSDISAQEGLKALKNGNTSSAFLREETLKREDLIDAFREKIFSAEKGTYTQPLSSPFGTHIYYISDILPERPGTFEDARERIKNDYIAEEMELRYPAYISEIEDKLAEGADIETSAASFGLTAHNITMDADGNILKGSAHKDADAPYFREMLRRVFSTETKDVPSPLFAADESGVFAVFTIHDILPERIKTLDEVRGVVADIRKTELRAQDITAHITSVLQASEDNADAHELMRELSDRFITPSETIDVRRPIKQAPPQLSDAIHDDIAQKIFDANVGDIVFDYNDETSSVVIAHVNKRVSAEEAAGAGRIADMRREYSSSFFEDFLAQYLSFLRRQYNVRYVHQGV